MWELWGAGFVRLALQQGAALVPVLALGELNTLRNFIDLPAIQVLLPSAVALPAPCQ